MSKAMYEGMSEEDMPPMWRPLKVKASQLNASYEEAEAVRRELSPRSTVIRFAPIARLLSWWRWRKVLKNIDREEKRLQCRNK